MVDIFISHIHEDHLAAVAFKKFLDAKLNGTTIFLSSDLSQLQLGDDWLQKIRESLQSSKVVLAVFSPASVLRPWVNFEAGGAWFSEDRILIPICIGGLRPENLPKPYSNIQGTTIDKVGHLRRLVTALIRILKLPQSEPEFWWPNDPDFVGFHELMTGWNCTNLPDENLAE